SNVHFTLGNRGFRLASGTLEQLVHSSRRHHVPRAVREVVHVQAKGPVLLDLDELVEDLSGVAGFTIGREAHELVFAAIYLEPSEVGQRGVEQAQRVREALFLEYFYRISATDRDASGRPLADSVERQDRRLLVG